MSKEQLDTELEAPEETSSVSLVQELQDQLQDAQEKYLRALADGENARKRMQKEKQEMTRFGIENAISEFLPAIDNFENALQFAQNASVEVQNWATGFQMILAQFKEVLASQDITTFSSEGTLFDPQYHDAMEMVETEEFPEGTILQECVKGYKTPLRTIRPARVKVAKAPHNPELSQTQQESSLEEQREGE